MEVIAGPIPGENYTSDTKNYPWHRPPEFDDLDEAIEYSAKKLTATNAAIQAMTLAKSGMSLTAIAQTYLMSGMMRGKWTPDYALLMAGPVTHILSLMAKAGDIDYSLGIDDEPVTFGDGFIEVMSELTAEEEAKISMVGAAVDSSEEDIEAPVEAPEESPVGMGGFAGMAAEEAPMAPEMPMDPETEIDMV